MFVFTAKVEIGIALRVFRRTSRVSVCVFNEIAVTCSIAIETGCYFVCYWSSVCNTRTYWRQTA